MDTQLIRLLTTAHRTGLTFTHDTTRVIVTGHPHDPTVVDQLRARRDDIHTLLAGPCAACGAPPWIHEHGTGIPWCRPDAQRRGVQLLTHERPDLVGTSGDRKVA